MDLFGSKELAQNQQDKKDSRRSHRIEKIQRFTNKITSLFHRKADRENESLSNFDWSWEGMSVLPDAEFEQLRAEAENPQDHEKYVPRVNAAIAKIKNGLKDIVEKYPEFKKRVERVQDRFIVLDRKEMSIFENAYMGHPIEGQINNDGEYEIDEFKYLAFYEPYGDYVVLPAQVDETIHGSLDFVLTEEFLHATQPFSPELGERLQTTWSAINEGATRYYLKKIHAGEHLPDRLTDPNGAILYTLVGEELWKTWVNTYGEDRMAESFFGRQPLPEGILIDDLATKGPIVYLCDNEGKTEAYQKLLNKK